LFSKIVWVVYNRGEKAINKSLDNGGIIILNASLGKFLINLLPEDTENLIGTYRHECNCYDLSGNKITVLIGEVNIYQGDDDVFTLRNLLNDCIEESGAAISDTVFLRHYNAAVSELSAMYNTAKVFKNAEYVVDDPSKLFNLDARLLKVERVLNSSGNNYPYFSVKSRQINFAEKGVYTLQGLFNPARVDNMTDGIEINPSYIPCVTKYIVSKVLSKSDKEESQRLFQEYFNLARLINDNLRKTTNPYIKVKAPKWR
jgi:hypothetical protein